MKNIKKLGPANRVGEEHIIHLSVHGEHMVVVFTRTEKVKVLHMEALTINYKNEVSYIVIVGSRLQKEIESYLDSMDI